MPALEGPLGFGRGVFRFGHLRRLQRQFCFKFGPVSLVLERAHTGRAFHSG